MKKGLVHIYTGNGKGKTTAAIGLGIRAYGRGFRVLMAQFLKGAETGELNTVQKLEPGFEIRRGRAAGKFIFNMSEEEIARLKDSMRELFFGAAREAAGGKWDMLILDEIMGCVAEGLITAGEVCDLIKDKPESLEIVMTGRNAPAELTELADYVSEIMEIKHPFKKGVPARKGVEF